MGMNIAQLPAQSLILSAGGVIVAVLILAALNRHLRLFTRGTVGFMVAVLMLVTVESVIEHLNDRRNADASIRAVAVIQTTENFLHSWFEHQPREMTAGYVDPGMSIHVDQRMTAIQDAILTCLPHREQAPDFAAWRMMALDVGSTYWRRNEQRFWALLDTSAEIVRVRGTVTLQDSTPPLVSDITFESSTVVPENEWRTYFRHAAWRNVQYEAQAMPGNDGARVKSPSRK